MNNHNELILYILVYPQTTLAKLKMPKENAQ
jgi:hypothetical protein